MPKTKKIPMRMCIACREMKPKKEMTRVAKNADGEIFFDPTGKAPGRGSYVCAEAACLKKMSDKKLLHKAFAAQVCEEVYRGVKEDGFGND